MYENPNAPRDKANEVKFAEIDHTGGVPVYHKVHITASFPAYKGNEHGRAGGKWRYVRITPKH